MRNSLKLVSRNTESAIEVPVIQSIEDKSASSSWWIGIFLVFTITVTSLVVNVTHLFPGSLSKSDIGKKAVKPVVSRRDFTFTPDKELLQMKRDEEAKSVKAVFSMKRNAWLDLWSNQILFAFRAMNDPIFRGKDEHARVRFNELAKTKIDSLTFWSLYNTISMSRVKQLLRAIFTSVLKDLILVENREMLRRSHPNGIEVLSYPREGDISFPQKIDISSDYKEIVDMKRLSAMFESEIETRFALGDKDSLDRDARKALQVLAMGLVRAHIGSNGSISLGITERPELTEKKREEIRKNYSFGTKTYKKGTIILAKGGTVSLETVKIYNAMLTPFGERLLWFMGYFGIISIFFLMIGLSTTQQFGGKRNSPRDFVISGLLIILILVLVKISGLIVNAFYPGTDAVIYPAIFPAAASSILVRVLMGTRMSVFFTMVISFLATWSIGAPIHIALFFFITGLFSSMTATRIEHRYVLWKAGLTVIATGFVLMTLYRLGSGEFLRFITLKYYIAVGIGGIVLSVIMSALLPLLEHIGDYVTDIKMLELANTEHPLQVELREKASGTFQHSHQVSELAFAAAKKVGANGLLVKIAAMYHDIGKTKQPKYFIENQTGDNPHNKLKPSMSALVIKNHVKDSREILEKAGFPAEVINVATSHHGTTLIEYFFARAKEQAGPEEVVREEDYRYPGPIPQTREAGILMLADAVEAAVKSKVMSVQGGNKTTKFDVNTIKETVLAIINKKFTDGQLDACELTLRNLSDIASSFITTLSSMHHERVAYPGQGEKNVNRRNSSTFPVVEPDKERMASSGSHKTPSENGTVRK
ncbi:HDIG domain-containing protein [Myxococcota bacterium]|nr:HDIG domain-containing protein [Myxococcota bacterium]MBU1382263.1 HDIG domain-containing protein [Myxococcota bacterium]MBU1498153.1 HDIG domain-containing protein [Myxococcota bacterium]